MMFLSLSVCECVCNRKQTRLVSSQSNHPMLSSRLTTELHFTLSLTLGYSDCLPQYVYLSLNSGISSHLTNPLHFNPRPFLQVTRAVTRFFQWTGAASDRLAFAEVLSSGRARQISPLPATSSTRCLNPRFLS